MQDKFVIDNSMHEDDSELEYRLSLETANGTILHSLDVAFQVRYSMVEDAKRWLRKGVLERFKLVPPGPNVEPHKRWQALPPIPATVLSHGGVLIWTSQRPHTVPGDLMTLDFWPSLADVIVVEEQELASCLARGYPCIPFPDEACHAQEERHEENTQELQCGLSRAQLTQLEQAIVVFVPSHAVDLIHSALLPLVQYEIVLITNEVAWWGDGTAHGRQGRRGAFNDWDTVNFRFRATAAHTKVVRWFARGLALENRHVSCIPAPIPSDLQPAVYHYLAMLDQAPPKGAPQTPPGLDSQCSPPAAALAGARAWLCMPRAHSLCDGRGLPAEVLRQPKDKPPSLPNWLLRLSARCFDVPSMDGFDVPSMDGSSHGTTTSVWPSLERHTQRETTPNSQEPNSQEQASGHSNLRPSAITLMLEAMATHRFCLLTEIESHEEYLVWLCIAMGGIPIVKSSPLFQVYHLMLPIVRQPPPLPVLLHFHPCTNDTASCLLLQLHAVHDANPIMSKSMTFTDVFNGTPLESQSLPISKTTHFRSLSKTVHGSTESEDSATLCKKQGGK